MNKLLLKKIEEITILMVKQQKEIDELKVKNKYKYAKMVDLQLSQIPDPQAPSMPENEANYHTYMIKCKF